jgi:hypothetical protein
MPSYVGAARSLFHFHLKPRAPYYFYLDLPFEVLSRYNPDFVPIGQFLMR